MWSGPKGSSVEDRIARAQDAKKALLERFRSKPGPGHPEYEARQAELKAVAEARRQREEARARQKAAEEAARIEATRVKSEAEAEAARKAAEQAARLAAEESAIMAQLKAEEAAKLEALKAEQKAAGMPAMRRARPPRRSGGGYRSPLLLPRGFRSGGRTRVRPSAFSARAILPRHRERAFQRCRSAAARLTRVQPRAPHPPGTGENTFGVVSISSACWSGVSPITPEARSGLPRVAKILGADAEVRGAHVVPSLAPGSDSAMRRNWLGVTFGQPSTVSTTAAASSRARAKVASSWSSSAVKSGSVMVGAQSSSVLASSANWQRPERFGRAFELVRLVLDAGAVACAGQTPQQREAVRRVLEEDGERGAHAVGSDFLGQAFQHRDIDHRHDVDQRDLGGRRDRQPVDAICCAHDTRHGRMVAQQQREFLDQHLLAHRLGDEFVHSGVAAGPDVVGERVRRQCDHRNAPNRRRARGSRGRLRAHPSRASACP